MIRGKKWCPAKSRHLFGNGVSSDAGKVQMDDVCMYRPHVRMSRTRHISRQYRGAPESFARCCQPGLLLNRRKDCIGDRSHALIARMCSYSCMFKFAFRSRHVGFIKSQCFEIDIILFRRTGRHSPIASPADLWSWTMQCDAVAREQHLCRRRIASSAC